MEQLLHFGLKTVASVILHRTVIEISVNLYQNVFIRPTKQQEMYVLRILQTVNKVGWSNNSKESVLKDGRFLLPPGVLMFLIPLLLLKLPLLNLKYLLIRFPPHLPMQHHTSFLINAVSNLRKRVVAAVVADFHFLIADSELFPAEIALIDESADAGYFAAVKGQQLYAHLHCHVLYRKICADKPDLEGVFLLFGFLFEIRSHFCHFFFVVFGCYPPLLAVLFARGFGNFAFWFRGYYGPALVLISSLLLLFLNFLMHCWFRLSCLDFGLNFLLMLPILRKMLFFSFLFLIRILSLGQLTLLSDFQKIFFLLNSRRLFSEHPTKPLFPIQVISNGNKLHIDLRERGDVTSFFGKLLDQVQSLVVAIEGLDLEG